jgi:hypothetical protein
MRNGSLLSRTAALLLLLAGCWCAWAFVEAPVLASVAADRERMQHVQAALSEPATGPSQAAALRAEQQRLSRFIDTLSWPLDRSSPELLSAQLQRAVEGLAASAGAAVASSRTLPVQGEEPAKAAGGLIRIGLDFDIQATLPSLQTLLMQIDHARPRIFVDRLTVQTAEGGGAAKAADGQSELSIAMQISIDAAPHRPDAAL